MTKKGIFFTIIITIIVGIVYMFDVFYNNKSYELANNAYKVYLNGKEIGLIDNQDELYNLINEEQTEIKEKYSVDNVYPPLGFEIMEVNTFNNNYDDIKEVYKDIEKEENFTIKGYIITVKSEDKENFTINVLDKEIFTKAINNFVLSFVSEDELEDYLNGENELEDNIGSVISRMYFNETLTIKEGYISVNDNIFTDVETLSQYLMFGPDAKIESYTVKLGDNIENISEAHKINSQEFIIANPSYRDASTILKVGQTVNVTVLNPVLTLTYEVDEMKETVTNFTSKTVVDSTKDPGYSEITTAGVNGISHDHLTYKVVNGERSSEVKTINSVIVREMVEQVTTVGRKVNYYISGSQVNIDGDWTYPTNYPYVITSPFGWRSSKYHLGIDISGTGYGSPIYAAAAGTVVEVGSRSTDGLFIIIDHGNNVYSQYAHLFKQMVSQGQEVTRGQRIGSMGQSGLASGPHLHFGICVGYPFRGAYSFQNPRNYINF